MLSLRCYVSCTSPSVSQGVGVQAVIPDAYACVAPRDSQFGLR